MSSRGASWRRRRCGTCNPPDRGDGGLHARFHLRIVEPGPCHGRDGAGGREGATIIPSIGWDSLTAPTRGRPPYTAESFFRVLKTGVSASGRVLDAAMPRYGLSAAQSQALVAYLKELPGIERRGIEADAVHLGVLSTPHSHAVASTYAANLEQALSRQKNACARYFRPHGQGAAGRDFG